MEEYIQTMDEILAQSGFVKMSPGESKTIFLGTNKELNKIKINSGEGKIYNALLDQVMEKVNYDNTIMLTRRSTDQTIADVIEIPNSNVKSASNQSIRRVGYQSNVVVSYSDMEHDKQRIESSNKKRSTDQLKLDVMKRISEEFDNKIQEAENNNNPTKAQDLKSKKNVAWSIAKNEIDKIGEDWSTEKNNRLEQIIQNVISSQDKYVDIEDYKIRSDISTNAYNAYNQDFRNFQNLYQTGERYYAYDIETIGDALNSNRFSIVEIAAQGYQKGEDGKFVINESDRLTALVELLPEERNELASIIEKLKKDSSAINGLEEYQRRSIVDLMRYSTVDHSKELLQKELMHNPIIDKVYGRNEAILTEYMIENMDTMIQHMESALENLTYREGKDNIVIQAKDAQTKFNQLIRDNKDVAFVGHNSRQFDDVKLKSWSSNDGIKPFKNEIELPINRIDYMNVIRAVYPDPRELLKQLWEQSGQDISNGILYEQGHTKLFELQRALNIELDEKHSALGDVGDKGLGGVLSKTIDTIMADIQKGELPTSLKGVAKNQGKILWSDTVLKEGQVFYANKGYKNYKKLKGLGGEIDSGKVMLQDIDTSNIDLSYMATFNEETRQFERITNDYNPTIINAKSFYEVQGYQDLGEGKVALRLYDRDQDKYSFIVREGEDAKEQIEDFVQRNLYEWNQYEKEQQQQILKNRKKDIARRRYDKMFSLSSSDLGRSTGFQSAQRYFKALELYEMRQAGKDLSLKKRAELNINNIIKRWKNPPNQKKKNELIQSEFERLEKNRLSHEEFITKLESKFMTMWDDKKSEWVFNKQEYLDFFQMIKRLQSEKEVYMPAIQAIQKEYGEEFESAKKRLEAATYGTKEFTEAKEAYGKIARQMDMAWNAYANDVGRFVPNLNKQVEKELANHEKKQVKVLDKGLNKEVERTLNFYDYVTARESLNNYAYKGLNHVEDKATRQKMARERLYALVNEMNRTNTISHRLYEEAMGELHTNRITDNAVTALASVFGKARKKEIKFEKELMVPTMELYDIELKVEDEYLELLAKHHIDTSKSYINFRPAPASSPNKFIFNDRIESLFDKVDNVDRPYEFNANNRKAIENLIESVLEQAPNHTIAFSWDQDTNNFNVSVIKDTTDNTIAIRELQEGKIPNGALNFKIPMAGQTGTHQVGNRVLNGKTIMEYNYETESIVQKSSTEKIADAYIKDMKALISEMKYSSTEQAQASAKSILNRVSNELAGIQRGSVSFSDTNYFSNNINDFIKQTHVDIQDVLIKQLLAGKLGDELRLHPKDFVDPTKVVNNQFIGKATMADLNFNVQYKAMLALKPFIDKNELDLNVSGVKDNDHAGKTLSSVDVRLLGPYRDFIAQTRSNSIQVANSATLDEDVISKLNDIAKSGIGVSTHQHVTVKMQSEFIDYWNSLSDNKGNKLNEGKALNFDMKIMYMNDTDVYRRLEWMAKQEEGLKILREEGIAELDKDGKVKFNPARMPRVYEQQIIINEDVSDALQTNLTKTFHNVTSFEGDMKKLLNGEKDYMDLKSGDLIGFNEQGEEVKWEKKHDARFTAQGGKAVAEWREKLFKLQVGGEKGTVNPFSQKFMEFFTGQKDIVAIMNPNVAKHLDLGMLYESKAGLFSEHARKLLAAGNKKELKKLNESVKEVGLEWDNTNKQYIEKVREHFANKDLDPLAFERIAKRHNIQSAITHEIDDLSKESLQRITALEESIKKLEKEKEKIKQTKDNAISKVSNTERIKNIQDEINSKQSSINNILQTNKKDFQIGILNTVASAVYDYSRAVDNTGREVIGFNYTKEIINTDGTIETVKLDKPTPIYAESKGNRGVAWGHRELAVLRQKGLNKTAEKMKAEMLRQSHWGEHFDEDGKLVESFHFTIPDKLRTDTEQEKILATFLKRNGIELVDENGEKLVESLHGPRISRLEEAHNLIETIYQMTDLNKDAKTISIVNGGDIEPLPSYRSDIHTLRNSIFDKAHILETLGEGANKHGYWLELPKAKLENGEFKKIDINVHGVQKDGYTLKDRVSSNKIFIPFTNLEGADGKVHLRTLQKKINDIYKRAKDVETAKTDKDRIDAMDKLQKAVDDYTERLVYDVTSSKGFIGSSVGRVRMGFKTAKGDVSSATGLFKLIDPITSAKHLDGEYTFISEDMAKKMINNEETLKKLMNGEHIYVMNNRYPTFHHDAMQVTKLKIDKGLANNEIHTTAFFSDLLKADSDGDYNNLVIDTDANIQKEWKSNYDMERKKYRKEMELIRQGIIPDSASKRYGFDEEELFKGKKATTNRTFDIESLIENIITDNEKFNPGKIMDRNTAEEIAAKIGKQTIGIASNLNLQMRQIAQDHLQGHSDLQEAMFRVGQILEQKLISSKHGVTVSSGKSPAMEFINLIKRSGNDDNARKETLRYADTYFKDLKLGDDLEKTLEGIRRVQKFTSEGINSAAMRAGTSRGINSRKGLQYIYDNIVGNVQEEDLVTSNAHLNILRHIETNAEGGHLEGKSAPREYNLTDEHIKEAHDEVVKMQESSLKTNTREKKKTFRETTKEFTGKVDDFLEKTPMAKKGLIGGGLALGGIGLYNVFNEDNPIPEMNQQAQQSPERENYHARPSKSALPPIDNSNDSQAVNVRVSTNGAHNINKGQVGGMISNSLNNSGVSSSGANMHITQRDNSSRLNSIWYRDKVQENI